MRFDWLGDSYEMREWVGPRIARQLKSFEYEVTYKEYELTHKVLRRDVIDNIIGPYNMAAFSGGTGAALLKPRLVSEALADGTSVVCYDGQFFFDTDHPVGEEGDAITVSNYFNAGGAQAAHPWYLMDLSASRAVKPIIALTREEAQYVSYQNLSDPSVFYNKEYIFGAQKSMGVAYGLWQTAARCEADITVNKIIEIDTAMSAYTGDNKNENGRRKKLGIKPTHIVFGRSQRERVKALLGSPLITTYSGDVMVPGATDSAKQNLIYGSYIPVEVSWLP
jgi:phage major head subunit gpT-like protein